MALGVAALVAAAFVAILILGGGDAAAIEKVLEQAAEAAGRGDPEPVVALISKDYRAPGREAGNPAADRDTVIKRIRAEIGAKRFDRVELVGLAVDVKEPVASATVRVRVKAGPYSLGEAQFALSFRKEGGAWKISWAEEIR